MVALELLVSPGYQALRVTLVFPVFLVAPVSQVKRESLASPDSLVLPVPSGPQAPLVWPFRGPKATPAPLDLPEDQVLLV